MTSSAAQGNPLDSTLEPSPTLIIGGGQAGLAVAYHLQQQRHEFIILDAQARTGDSWRKRWDSLTLFTPAGFASLPGMAFPGSPDHYPTKDEMADYLDAYAQHFAFPIRHQTKVTRLEPQPEGFLITTPDGQWRAPQVVVATGAYQRPYIPKWAQALSPNMKQLHSSHYRNPNSLVPGRVLLVGAGNSGAQLGLELASEREVILAGRSPGVVPARPRWLINLFRRTVMTIRIDTPWGRLLKARGMRRGTPIMGISERQLKRAGIKRVGRVQGVRDGKPLVTGVGALETANIIWCTGFRPDFSWLELPAFDEHGYPHQRRGVVSGADGLYLLGLPFLSRLNSALIAGVGVDAAHVAGRVIAHQARLMRGRQA